MKETLGERIFNYINIILLFFISIAAIYPFVYVVFASLSDPVELMAHRGVLLKPLGFSVQSYIEVFKYPAIMRGYLNTIIIVVGGTLLNLVMTSLGAYFLSRKDVMFRNVIMMGIVVTMFFSGGIIPMFLTIQGLHLTNNLLSLILPVAINTTNLIILRTAFAAIPESLVEAATIDGAGHFKVLYMVMVPLAKPTLATLTLFYAVYHWNSWFNASMFMTTNRDLYPLQLILREILIMNDTTRFGMDSSADAMAVADSLKYSVIVFATLPILILYPFLQKYFVKGVMIGAVKG